MNAKDVTYGNKNNNPGKGKSQLREVSQSKVAAVPFDQRIDRLKQAVEAQNDSDLAKKLGVSHQSVASARKRQQVPVGWVAEVAARYGISADWILFGDRNLQSGGFEQEGDFDEYVFVPLVDGQVRAGPDGGILYEKIREKYPFKRRWIEKKIGATLEHIQALVQIQVQGESMIPTVYPGEMILVDTWEGERVTVRSGKMYLVRLPDGSITVKRLALSERRGEVYLICLSDNQNFEPFEFPLDAERDIRWYVLGRIRWVGREIE